MSYDELGRSIVSFLDDALVHRVPDRDIPRSERIRCEVASEAPSGAEEYNAAILAVAQPVVDSLGKRPEQWDEAINLIAIYLDELRPVEVGVPEPLKFSSVVLRALLQANPAGRQVFFERIGEWNVLSALEPILASIDLDGREAAVLLRCIDTRTANDMARGMPMRALKRWATGYPETARSIVEAWLNNEAWARELGLSPLQIMIEGVVKAGSRHLEWRNLVLDRLIDQNDEQYWGLAAILACFAWPEPEPPVEERHRALVEHVKRLPSRLLAVGLNALARDARDHPAASIATALRLIELTRTGLDDVRQRQDRAIRVAIIGCLALQGAAGKSIVLTEVYSLLPIILDAPAHEASGTLDVFVANLAKLDATRGEAFAGQWLAKHLPVLRKEMWGIQDILPLFAHERGPEAIGGWLVRCLVDRDAELRVAAAFLTARKKGFVIKSEAFTALSKLQAEALAHELVGIGVPGNVYVPMLIHMAKVRTDIRETVREILLEDAIEDYPGACGEALERWKAEEDADDASLTSLRTALIDHLDERRERYKPQIAVPELRMTSPVRQHWWTLHNRIFQEATRRESARSVLLQFATTVSIARGEAMTMFRHDAGVIPLQRFSGAMEFPVRQHEDHIAMVLSRIAHRKHAAELLARDEAS